MRTAREVATSVDCPFPSCGAKAGKACNSPRGGMSVGMVEQPFVHVGRAERAIAARDAELLEAAAKVADDNKDFVVAARIRALAPLEKR